MSTEFERYDAVVVGLGAWGSAVLWRLASRGIRVLGIEQFPIGHQLGATHGKTRIFRVACQEHPGLAPIARRSRDLWQQLASETGHVVLRPTPVVTIGDPDADYVIGAQRAAEVADCDVETLDHAAIAARYPAFTNTDPRHIAVVDSEGGLADPDLHVRATVGAAINLGADVWAGTRCNSVTQNADGTVVAQTSNGRTVYATDAVLTIGPWLGKFLGADLPAQRTPLHWFRAKPGAEAQGQLENLPVFMKRIDEHSIWGHGSFGDTEIKIGLGINPGAFADTDPDNCFRGIDRAQDWDLLSEYVKSEFSWIDPTPIASSPCMISTSPDEQFVVGRHPKHDHLYLAGGCTGHGFKHAMGLGELIAADVVSETQYCDTEFLRPERLNTWSKS